MKTAISVRDNLFDRVERYAKGKNISRSRLFSDAVEEYLDSREDDVDVTASLNKVYSTEDSSVDPVLLKMSILSLPREEW